MWKLKNCRFSFSKIFLLVKVIVKKCFNIFLITFFSSKLSLVPKYGGKCSFSGVVSRFAYSILPNAWNKIKLWSLAPTEDWLLADFLPEPFLDFFVVLWVSSDWNIDEKSPIFCTQENWRALIQARISQLEDSTNDSKDVLSGIWKEIFLYFIKGKNRVYELLMMPKWLAKYIEEKMMKF